MSKMKEKLKALREPFPPECIEWRPGSVARTGQSCTLLAYLKVVAVEDRLDEVFGDVVWECDYKPGPMGGLLCGIKVEGKIRWDGGDNTNIEAVKGGLSDSFKRAARRWGVGRYLWKLGNEWHETVDHHTGKEDGVDYVKVKLGDKWSWVKTPTLPAWALPPTPKHPSWKDDQGLFCQALNDLGRTYDDVAEWCESLGRPRPSRMTSSEQRSRLLDYLESTEGVDSINDWLAAS